MKGLNYNKYVRWTLALAFGLSVFFFWFIAYPQALNYQEQNQLFLFSTDYFMERMSVPGGLADYLSEFIVQFYYIPWMGSLLLALLFTAMQQLLWCILAEINIRWKYLSILPPVLVLGYMEDVNVLLSFPVALTLSLFLFKGMDARWMWADVIVIPLGYWLLGPMIGVYVLLRILEQGLKWAWTLLYLWSIQVLAYVLFLQQWPYENVMFGLNYYFRLMHTPALQIIIPLVVPVVVCCAKWFDDNKGISKGMIQIAQLIIIVFSSGYVFHKGYDKDLYELLMQDKLVREEKWTEIIERAEQYQVHTNFSSNCVNLALAQKRQLADRMFQFYQSGEAALMVGSMNDNMSAYPTMEAFWRLGLVNSCLRYASDLQESILNARKSGRLTKRIVECQMVNGNYPIAKKHIDLLKQSLFYSQWANEMESLLDNEAKINDDPILGKVRKLRFKKDFIFSYEEIEKIMGLLFVDNSDNKMALDYFMGVMLLKGNINGFSQYMSWVQQYGGYSSMPIGYQDAMKCIQAKGNVPTSPYAAYVKRMMNQEGGK